MKRFMVAFLALMLIGGSAYALGDNENEQAQGQIGINSSRNSNENENENDNRNYNDNKQAQGQGQAQGQLQGQLQGQAQGQGQGQGQVSVGRVDVADNSEYKSYSFSPPGLSANQGVNEANMYSIFGGIGLSETAEYKVCVEKLAVIERLQGAGYLTKEEAKAEALAVYLQMKEVTKDKRLLGVLCKTSGKNLLNMFGMLSWDSFWKEGQTPVEKMFEAMSKEKVRTDDSSLEGNAGNFPGGIQ